MISNTLQRSAEPRTHTTLAALRHRGALYAELVKSRLSGLVVMTTAVGYIVTSDSSFDGWRFVWTVLGTALAAGGANGLNQCIEAARDQRMERTRTRPLPSGALSRAHAIRVTAAMSVAGPLLLLVAVNALTAGLAAITIALYLFAYTPLKPRSPICTLVGAIPGAIPPMMGCSGAVGHLDHRAWLLFLTLFVWQIPHFLSLAWLYREDYARGGFRMLPIIDRNGTYTFRMIVLYTLALVPLVIAVTLSGMAGWVYAAGGLALSLWFMGAAWRLQRSGSDALARRVFLVSLVYLPAILILMAVDRGPASGVAPGPAVARAVALTGNPTVAIGDPAVATSEPVVPDGDSRAATTIPAASIVSPR